MLKTKTKIILGISLTIFASMAISPFAAAVGYSHGYKVQGIDPDPFFVEFYFSAELDVTSNGQDITSYDGDWHFWGDRDWLWWPFWYIEWRIGVVTTVYTEKYVGGHLDAVRYSATGRIIESDGYPHAWMTVWVEIDADGVKTQGSSIWDDSIVPVYGYIYWGVTY